MGCLLTVSLTGSSVDVEVVCRDNQARQCAWNRCGCLEGGTDSHEGRRVSGDAGRVPSGDRELCSILELLMLRAPATAVSDRLRHFDDLGHLFVSIRRISETPLSLSHG